MLLKDAIQKLEATDAGKALAGELRAEFTEILEVDSKDLGKRLKDGEAAIAQVKTLSDSVKKLEGEAKGAVEAKAKVEQYETQQRDALIAASFDKAAKDAGVKAAALGAARKLANLGAVKADLEKQEVSGLTKDVFEGLKKDHAFLFEDAKAGEGEAGGASRVPALPPAANGASPASSAAPALPGAIGLFVQAAKAK